MVGADANVLRVNKAYTRITGFGDEFVGQDLRLLLRKGVLRHSVTLEVIKHRIPITMMHHYPTGNVGLVTGTPVFDRDGKLAVVIVNVRDITQLNKLRERLGGGAFLGEVAELGTSLQVKLLNVIEGQVVHRIGSRHGIPIDVRLIAATNRDLDAMVRDGRFREVLEAYEVQLLKDALARLRTQRVLRDE